MREGCVEHNSFLLEVTYDMRVEILYVQRTRDLRKHFQETEKES